MRNHILRSFNFESLWEPELDLTRKIKRKKKNNYVVGPVKIVIFRIQSVRFSNSILSRSATYQYTYICVTNLAHLKPFKKYSFGNIINIYYKMDFMYFRYNSNLFEI